MINQLIFKTYALEMVLKGTSTATISFFLRNADCLLKENGVTCKEMCSNYPCTPACGRLYIAKLIDMGYMRRINFFKYALNPKPIEDRDILKVLHGAGISQYTPTFTSV